MLKVAKLDVSSVKVATTFFISQKIIRNGTKEENAVYYGTQAHWLIRIIMCRAQSIVT